VAEVEPDDDSIRRFIVWHYRYDPDRHERRHVVVAAFDNDREFEACLEATEAELRRRRGTGEPADRGSTCREAYTSRAIGADSKRGHAPAGNEARRPTRELGEPGPAIERRGGIGGRAATADNRMATLASVAPASGWIVARDLKPALD
jgi:hypothetical protein